MHLASASAESGVFLFNSSMHSAWLFLDGLNTGHLGNILLRIFNRRLLYAAYSPANVQAFEWVFSTWVCFIFLFIGFQSRLLLPSAFPSDGLCLGVMMNH